VDEAFFLFTQGQLQAGSEFSDENPRVDFSAEINPFDVSN
jgi:hypothetical protein